jgi:hypothetical protein
MTDTEKEALQQGSTVLHSINDNKWSNISLNSLTGSNKKGKKACRGIHGKLYRSPHSI